MPEIITRDPNDSLSANEILADLLCPSQPHAAALCFPLRAIEVFPGLSLIIRRHLNGRFGGELEDHL